jgi:biotin transport system substrate-specific component
LADYDIAESVAVVIVSADDHPTLELRLLFSRVWFSADLGHAESRRIRCQRSFDKDINVTTTGLTAPRILSDFIPRPADATRAVLRDAVLVLGFAGLTALLAQFSIVTAWSPVPITGQTLGVLLAGATLGSFRGGLSMAVYWLIGMISPFAWYASGNHGWESATGGTMGYLVGFIIAAAFVGHMAERHQDREFATSIPAMLFASVIIYGFGVAWLKYNLDVPWHTNAAEPSKTAMNWGVYPFLIGDLVKLTIAGAATPAAWKLFSK